MACKVPAIATRVGGVPELIDDGVTGLLLCRGRCGRMAAGAIGLLKDRDRLEAMRDAARKDAQKRFCATLVVPQYVKYYEQVLGTAIKTVHIDLLSLREIGLEARSESESFPKFPHEGRFRGCLRGGAQQDFLPVRRTFADRSLGQFRHVCYHATHLSAR